MPAIQLPWSSPDFQINTVKVGSLAIDSNLNLTFTDLNGNTQGPYLTNLNTQSGSLGNTSTCDATGCLTISGVVYDKMTGNLTAAGMGNGNIHVQHSLAEQDNSWSADDNKIAAKRAGQF